MSTAIAADIRGNRPGCPTQPEVPAALEPVRARTLTRGAQGPAVRELQRKLVMLRFLASTDLSAGAGVFGPRTRSAVMAFQRRHGIRPTGQVGPLTLAALDKALAARSAPPAPRLPPPAPSGFGYLKQFDGKLPAAGLSAPRGMPLQPAVSSTTGNRNAARYSDVIDQFAVTSNPRYALPSTSAALFAHDVTSAMGAPLPLTHQGRALDAKGMIHWLTSLGATRGWRRVDATSAQAYANAGRPAVAVGTLAHGGHLAVLRPGATSDGGAFCAQGGPDRFNQGSTRRGFGKGAPSYYVHA